VVGHTSNFSYTGEGKKEDCGPRPNLAEVKTLSEKQTEQKNCGHGPMVACLPSKNDALSSFLSTSPPPPKKGQKG
jgi:hypothetical protein